MYFRNCRAALPLQELSLPVFFSPGCCCSPTRGFVSSLTIQPCRTAILQEASLITGHLPQGRLRLGSKAKTGTGGPRGWTEVLGGGGAQLEPTVRSCSETSLSPVSQLPPRRVPCDLSTSLQPHLEPAGAGALPEGLWQLPQVPEVGLLPESSKEAPSAGGEEQSIGVLPSERQLENFPPLPSRNPCF